MIKIRIENDHDQKAVYQVNQLAFGQESEPKLVDNLRRSKNWVDGLSLVAEKDGVIVGHVLFTEINIEPYKPGFTALSLAPLAVLPDHQRQTIGSKLMFEGIKNCRSRGYNLIIVVGHPEYYPRFGFVPARNNGLESSIPVPDEAFMVLELVPGTLNGVEGTVIFPPEFELDG